MSQSTGSATFSSSGSLVTAASIKLRANTFSKANCKFKGWSESSTATTPTYTDGGTYNFSKNTTLYAVWESTYNFTLTINSVTFDSSGGAVVSYVQKATNCTRYANQSVSVWYAIPMLTSTLGWFKLDGSGNGGGTTSSFTIRYATYQTQVSFGLNKLDGSSAVKIGDSQTVTLSEIASGYVIGWNI